MRVFDVHAPTPQGPAAKDQQAFLVGVSFHEAALRAGCEARDPKGVPIVALCPMIVCYAFAVELYLKSLSSKSLRNHRLNVLYCHLDIQLRHEISMAYTKYTGRHQRELETDLRQFAKAFVEWRYVFEGEGQQLRVNLLIAVTKAIYSVIRLRHSEWIVNPHQESRLLADEERPSMTVANLGGGTLLHIVDGTGGKLSGP